MDLDKLNTLGWTGLFSATLTILIGVAGLLVSQTVGDVVIFSAVVGMSFLSIAMILYSARRKNEE